MNHLDEHDILTNTQHGFRKLHSCTTQHIRTIQELAKSVDDIDNNLMSSCLISLKCLTMFHIWGCCISWNSMVLLIIPKHGSQTSSVIPPRKFFMIASHLKHHQSSQECLDQGSVLCPLLFLLFIDDLPDTISSQSTIKLFADDCILYRSSFNKTSISFSSGRR